jgi:hypothetical protein
MHRAVGELTVYALHRVAGTASIAKNVTLMNEMTRSRNCRHLLNAFIISNKSQKSTGADL